MRHDLTLLRTLSEMNASPCDDHSLAALAARAGRSPFHLHRSLRALLGETPKQYALRVRLERAAAALVASDEPIVTIALDAGFHSHEVFTRAFRRRFGCTPARYRSVALRCASAAERRRHGRVVATTAPCIALFRHLLEPRQRRSTMPTSPIERRTVAAEPILFIRRQVSRAELAPAIGQCLGAILAHAQKNGIALAGQPLTRYPSAGPGLVTAEIGFRIAGPAAGEGEIEAGTLVAGPAAFAVHQGPYDTLAETYAALERWMAANGARPRGAPWEIYVTDPGEQPNPAEWLTEVYWPLEEGA